jgi:uncharacterized protein YjbI with pentapeptide repeats
LLSGKEKAETLCISIIMTPIEFFDAYNNGQRHFKDLDFENLEGFSNRDFSNIIFQNCFLYVDFSGSNLTNGQFINCNIKEIDLRNTNLTNAVIKNCLIESAMFYGATTTGFQFIENYYYGLTLEQQDFDTVLYKTGNDD